MLTEQDMKRKGHFLLLVPDGPHHHPDFGKWCKGLFTSLAEIRKFLKTINAKITRNSFEPKDGFWGISIKDEHISGCWKIGKCFIIEVIENMPLPDPRTIMA